MKKYKRLDLDEREEISRMLAQNCSLNRIARSLGRRVSTISREIRAGNYSQSTYRAGRSQRRAERNSSKRKENKRKIDFDQKLKQYIHKKLRLKWSPAQIAKELKKDYPLEMNMHIAPEAIYTYLYVLPRGSLKKELLVCLRQSKKWCQL